MYQLINPGVLLMLITACYQSTISAVVKLVSPDITTEIQVLAYYFIPLFFFIPFLLKNGFSGYKTNHIVIYFFRGLFAAGSVFCFFYASKHIQLGVASILFNSSPVFVPILARVILKEKTSIVVYFGIAISLIGIIFVIQPDAMQFISPVTLIGLASGFLMAFATVLLRYLVKQSEPTNRILFYLYLSCTLVSLIFIFTKDIDYFSINGIVAIDFTKQYFVLSMLFLLGVLSYIAQRTLTKAFQYLPAAKLMPLFYISVPISSLIGWLFWDQQITLAVGFGTLLVTAGVVIIVLEKNIMNLFCFSSEQKNELILTMEKTK